MTDDQKDAARYRFIRSMDAGELEQFAWQAENAEDFDRLIDEAMIRATT